ncbi:hypothetical protein BKA00_002543 [Actinomadura coerulea]|uniref:Uncharacterized protein n=1 Tax=Actinomadura coerulea TaxID=46159 RepID=A0A7X0KYZ3_9ACTN|nr:hypothetical protein [Actinomadura coerulea]GGQ24978.1 hypothetical protein GCM10010187_46740 [Actinomadura coerulea]
MNAPTRLGIGALAVATSCTLGTAAPQTAQAAPASPTLASAVGQASPVGIFYPRARAHYSVPLYAERRLDSQVVGGIVAGYDYEVRPGWEKGAAFPDGYCGTSGTVNDHWRPLPLPGGRTGWTSTMCIW